MESTRVRAVRLLLGVSLRNIGRWRVKETDRIAAMATELRKLRATDDHRMAMSSSLVSLGGIPVRINDLSCVGKTFPDYFPTPTQHQRNLLASC